MSKRVGLYMDHITIRPLGGLENCVDYKSAVWVNHKIDFGVRLIPSSFCDYFAKSLILRTIIKPAKL